MEETASAEGRALRDLPLAEQDQLWEAAKRNLEPGLRHRDP
jgi:hypothetical protein